MIRTLGLEAYFNFGWMNLKLWLDEFITLGWMSLQLLGLDLHFYIHTLVVDAFTPFGLDEFIHLVG